MSLDGTEVGHLAQLTDLNAAHKGPLLSDAEATMYDAVRKAWVGKSIVYAYVIHIICIIVLIV
jgi:t-SNARE complex subunit (syntaxin)